MPRRLIVQVPRRGTRQSPQHNVVDCHHVPERRLWWYCSKHLLWPRYCRHDRYHGEYFPLRAPFSSVTFRYACMFYIFGVRSQCVERFGFNGYLTVILTVKTSQKRVDWGLIQCWRVLAARRCSLPSFQENWSWPGPRNTYTISWWTLNSPRG